MIQRKPHIPSFKRVVAPLLKHAMPTSLKIVQTFAEDQLNAFVKRIKDQDFKSFHDVPLSEQWLAYKIKHDLDMRTMIATEHYIKAIQVLTHKESPDSITVYIGFKMSEMVNDRDGNPTDFPMYRLAEVHEYGSQNHHTPARPHWKPQVPRIRKAAIPVRRNIQKEIMALVKGVGY